MRNWRRLHRDAVVVDGHMDTFMKALDEGKSWDDPQPSWQIDHPRLRRGGVDLQICAIYTPPRYQGAEAALYASRMIGKVLEAERTGRGRTRIVRSRRELDGVGRGATALLISIEGGLPLAGRLDMLDVFFALGVRAMGLTHNPRTLLADGATVERGRGLTALGRDVVRRMDALGMVVDVAHLHPAGFGELLRLARGPVVSSHTGFRRWLDIPRNLSDAQAKAVARTGGLVAIDFYPGHLLPGPGPVTLPRMVDQLEAVADLVGVDHVGLGGDFDGIERTVTGLEDVSRTPRITRELVARGWTDREIRKVLGGNWMRVLKTVLR
ncbi:MAG: membrane dipeptidase [Candidatus Brocadiae bacterium]|nr:membrane dipeptidase [Candidatus Brocadiia bacterium]